MYKDIGHLKIPMDDKIISKISQPFENVFYIVFCLKFLHDSFALELTLQISLVTELSDDVAVTIACKHFETS